ncbi:MAG: aminotransferase class V-fold PLP-dependent enzyme [Bryobacteraceae bacterium]
MQNSRRGFLRAAASWAAMAQALKAAPSSAAPRNEEYWSVVRRQFPLDENLIYLNTANVGSSSRAVLDRHQEFLRDFQANPSFQNREKYEGLRSATRAKLGKFLGVQAQEIAFTRNTSEASNIIVHGLDLKAGDEVLITNHNHQCNKEAWEIRARREGIVVKKLPITTPAASRESLIAQFEAAITPRTRVIGLTHVTNTTGLMFPVLEIAKLARAKNIWLHLDGAQTFGLLDIHLKSLDVDSFAASTHKWLMGPLEAGILYVREERLKEVWPSIVTAGWSDNASGAAKLENFGQRDDPRLTAIDAAIDFTNLIGVANIESRVRYLATRFKEKCRAIPGLKLRTNMQPELCGGIVKVSTGEENGKRHYDALYRDHRIATSLTPTGDASGIRFSAHVYNSIHDIDRAADALQRVAG